MRKRLVLAALAALFVAGCIALDLTLLLDKTGDSTPLKPSPTVTDTKTVQIQPTRKPAKVTRTVGPIETPIFVVPPQQSTGRSRTITVKPPRSPRTTVVVRTPGPTKTVVVKPPPKTNTVTKTPPTPTKTCLIGLLGLCI